MLVSTYLRYAIRAEKMWDLNLQIGNSRQVIRCPNTGGWYDKFEETEIYINLPKGQSVLCITPGMNGGPILDKFELFKEVTD